MSDTSSRSSVGAPRTIADALLRTLSRCDVNFRLTNVNCQSSQSELGLQSTSFIDVAVGPAALRQLKPSWQADGCTQWELLVSASGVHRQVNTLQIDSARSLFELTKGVVVAGQSYLIESFTANEAFGGVYLYRLLLREARDGIL